MLSGMTTTVVPATPRRHHYFAGFLSRIMMAAGLVLIAATLATIAQGLLHQRDLDRAWQAEVKAHPPPAVPKPPPADATPQALSGVDFAIRVPRIGYYAAVQEGITSNILISGPGHYPGTRWPGQDGNVGVAAHNTYWMRFGDLGPGDEIDLETRYGVFRYTISGKRIVAPSDTSVLAQTAGEHLTLTTC